MEANLEGEIVIRGIKNNGKRSLEVNSGAIIDNQLQDTATSFKRGIRHIHNCPENEIE
jgi:hypothetical protein